MRKLNWSWLRLLLGGSLLFGASATSCTTDTLRGASDVLDGWANDLDGEDDDWWDDVIDEMEDWF